MKQRCLSLLMAFFMMLTLFPANAFAREVITSEETVEAVASAEELVEDEAEEVNSDTSFTDDNFIVSETEAEATEYAPLEADSSYVEDSILLSSSVSAYASATDETAEIDAGDTNYLDKVALSRDGSLSETELNYIRNDYIEACIRNDGRYTIGTIEGNPDISTDNNKKLLCGHPGSSTTETLIQIDGTDWFLGYQEGERCVNASSVSVSESGTSCIAAAIIGDTGVVVQQILTLEKNSVTGREDVIGIRYTCTNTSSQTRQVGIRIMLDTMMGNNDGSPFRVNNQEVTTELEFTGDNVPQYWQSFDSLSNPNVVSTGTFYRNVSEKPDKVQYAYWREIAGSAWDYRVSTDRSITKDSAVAVYFNPRTLPAGGSSSVVTYYGVGQIERSLGELDIGINHPSALERADGIRGYENNPFDISVYLTNNSDVNYRELRAVLSIADSSQSLISLSEAQNSRTEPFSLPIGGSHSIRWTLRAFPQTVDTRAEYRVSVFNGNELLKTIAVSTLLTGLGNEERYCTVTFDLNGAIGTPPDPQRVLIGKHATKPSSPKREGYFFRGWYANPACEGKQWFSILNLYRGTRILSDLTLYAKWTNSFMIEEDDLYSFGNYKTNFHSTYQLADEYYDVLIKGIEWSENFWWKKDTMAKKRDEKWNGSCLGMGVTEALFKLGVMDLAFFAPGANTVKQIETEQGTPATNSRVESFINYYQLLQYRSEYADHATRLFSNSNFDVCSVLLDAVRSAYKNNTFVLILILSRDATLDKTLGGHALMGYRVTEEGNNQYRIHVMESNENEDAKYSYLIFDLNSNNVTFHCRWNSSPNFRDISLLDGTLKIDHIVPIDSYNCIDLQSELIKRGNIFAAPMSASPDEEESAHGLLTTNYAAFTISNDSETSTVKAEQTEGSFPITFQTIFAENSIQYVYEIPDGYSFEITPAKDDNLTVYETSFGDERIYASVEEEHPAVVRIDTDELAVACLADAPQTLEVTIAQQNSSLPVDALTLKGTLAEVVLSCSEDGFAAVSSESLTGSTLVFSNERNSIEHILSADTDSIQISGNTEGGLTITDEFSHVIASIPMTYTVSFYTHGGSLLPSLRGLLAGSMVERPADPVFNGYLFAGWYLNDECTDGNEFDFEHYRVEGDVTLHAKWLVDESYSHSVTFKAEGSNDIIIEVLDGESLSTNQIPAVPHRPGYRGIWDRENFTNIRADLIVNAIYVLSDEVVISFDTNGGTGNMEDVSVPAGSVWHFPANRFIPPENMSFKAWEVAGREYQPNEEITVTASITVKAIWQNPPLAWGYCGGEGDGTNLKWTLNSNGVLTISGSGKMSEYDYNSVPWYSYRAKIKTATLQSGVTSISKYAFSLCENLTSVTIPDGVTSIGGRAFYKCESLQKLHIPSSVLTMGQLYREDGGVFGGSKFQTAGPLDGGYDIEYSWTDTIPESAFISTTSLIPDTLVKIGWRAFNNCPSLESLNLPDNITSISNYAFSGCRSLESLTLPEKLKFIGDEAFAGCSNLKDIYISDNVTSIGKFAFAGCDFANINVSPSNQSFSSIEGVLFDKDCATLIQYPSGNSRTSYDVPETVTRIEPSSFSSCENLKKVTIPEGVLTIGRGAFSGCLSLENITIPATVTDMGKYSWSVGGTTYTSDADFTFSGCSSLISFNVAEGNQFYSSVDGVLFNQDKTVLIRYPCSNPNTSYHIPNGVVTIESAFSHCANLTSVTIPNGVSRIDEAFLSCTNLLSIYIPASVSYIESSAFQECDSLSDVYYGGTQAQWEQIVDSHLSNFLPLHRAVKHYEWRLGSTYYVYFNPNGGTVNLTSKSVTNGDVYGELPVPTRINYRFDGWFTSASGGTQITSATTVNLTEDQTLYAHWTNVLVTYTVTFNPNGGTVNPASKTVINGGTYGELPTPTRGSDRFDGWFTSISGGTRINSSTTVNLTEDQTLYAHWTEPGKSHTVYFAANGGYVNPASKSVTNGDPYGDLPIPGKRGQTFDGWYTEVSAGTQIYGITIVSLEADQTLYAHWTEVPDVVPPTVTTNAATAVSSNAATLSGTLNDNGGDTNLTRQFIYWNKLDPASRYTVNVDSGFQVTVNNLSPDSTYYYYAKATNAAGDGVGSVLSLKTDRAEEPVSISVEPTYLSLEIGDVYQLLATVLPTTAANRNVTWSTSDASTVSVDNTGKATAIKHGTAIITVTTEANQLSAICTVEVEEPEPAPEIKGTFDFSEWNMASNTGNYAKDGFDFNQGGNLLMASAYLARWDGAVLETNDPYPAYNGDPRTLYKEIDADYHVQNIIWLPARKSSTDNNEIKAAVVKYGAAYESFVVNDDYFDDSQKNYYYPPNGLWSWFDGGHAVAVIGWDDNYSASNFVVSPPADGAFICRNSWGADSGEEGYFYVSYYDKYFGIRNGGGMIVPSIEYSTNYNKVYQYDPLGACSALGFESTTYAANVFPQNGSSVGTNEALKAVSFYTYDRNTSYEVYVVENYQSKASLGNKGNAVASGTLSDMGYHTIVLNTPVKLNAGTRFAVIIKFTVSDGSAYVYYEYPEEDYSSKARANSDEGYYSPDGVSWVDLTTKVANANFCIKAFTENRQSNNSALLLEAIDNDNRTYESNQTYTLQEAVSAGILISDEFLKWKEQSASLMNADSGSESLGEVPSIATRGSGTISFIEGAILPSKYDLRTEGCVTAIRDQGNWGSCWTFATYASLESCLLKKAKTVSISSVGGVNAVGDFLARVGQSGISATKITLSKDKISLTVGESQHISVAFEPANATETAVIWQSSDESVATVDTNGTVTAHKVGTVTIQATTVDGKLTASCHVTVSNAGIISYYGDLDGNGEITVLEIQQIIASKIARDNDELIMRLADLNGNGEITVLEIQQIIASKITRHYLTVR